MKNLDKIVAGSYLNKKRKKHYASDSCNYSIVGLALLILLLVYMQNLLIFWPSSVRRSSSFVGILSDGGSARMPVYKLPGVLLGWLFSLVR